MGKRYFVNRNTVKKEIFHRIVLGLFFFCLFSESFSNELLFKNISVDEGLSNHYVTNIFQDSRGFIWIGTLNGLNRYDGREVVNFFENAISSNQMHNDRVLSISEDEFGNIWVGTGYGGVEIFDIRTQNFSSIILDKQNNFNNVIHSICKLSNGDMVCGTRTGSLFRFKAASIKEFMEGGELNFERLNFIVGQKDNKISRIIRICETKNNIWLLDWESKVYRMDYSSVNTSDYFIQQVLTNIPISDIEKVNDSELLMGSQIGVIRFEAGEGINNKDRNWSVVPNTKEINVSGLVIDKNNNCWASGFNSAIYRISDFQSSNPGVENYTIDENVRFRAGLVDRSNVLWLFSAENGIASTELSSKNFNKKEFTGKIFDKEKIINVVSALYDSQGRLWIGSNNRLSIYKLEANRYSEKAYSIQSRKIIEDKRGYIWIASHNGVWFNNPKINKGSELNRFEFSQFGYPETYNFGWFNSIDEDMYGNLWMTTDRELIYLIRDDKGFFRDMKVLRKDDNTNLYPTDIQVVKSQSDKPHLWLMQRNSGVSILKYNAQFTLLTIEKFGFKENGDNYLPTNTVNNIIFEGENVWLCSDNGLIELGYNSSEEKYRFRKFYTTDDGLPSNILLSIEKDTENNLWIGTNKGLSKYDQKSNSFQNFTTDDGLRSSSFINSSFQMADGTLVFGTAKGLISFLPEDIELHTIAPQIVFTSLEVKNNLVLPLEKLLGSVILKNSITETNDFLLNYKQNDFSIGFSALHFASPKKNRYAYRLDGYQKEWIYTDQNMPFAYYSNLSPGNYTLFVKASNNDNFWTENPIAIKIEILPPPWKTWWAYLSYILFLFAITFLALRIWSSRLKFKNEAILEKKQREIDFELNEMKFRFFTDISHEFRTPLTLINGPVKELVEIFRNDKKIYPILYPLNLNVTRMQKLINQLLDFRKAEKDKLKLLVSMGNIIETLTKIKSSYEEEAISKGIKLEFRSDYKDLAGWYDEDKLEKIIHNLLSNAFKYTPAKGKITLEFDIMELEQAVISVKDTGKGISETSRQKIFDRFYHEGSESGTGIGLALAKNLVEIHKGSISVKSQLGEGSIFKVFLSLKQETYFNEIQKQVAKQGLENHPNWITSKYEEERFDDMSAQGDDVPLILIVEDNKEIREYLQRLLNIDFRTVVAVNGLNGVEIASEFIPNMIISDILMPEMDGIEMCKELKKNSNTSHIPLIFLTAKTSDINKIEGLNTGAADYIVKPFDPNELKIKVENILTDRKNNQDRLRKDFILSPAEVKVESPEEIFLQQAVRIIEEHMGDGDFNLVNLCSQLGISRMQLHRKLKLITGQSTTEFIRSIRLKRAAQLLETGHLTALEVMYEVGIESSSYFSKAFKKQYGVPPIEYSERHKSKKKN